MSPRRPKPVWLLDSRTWLKPKPVGLLAIFVCNRFPNSGEVNHGCSGQGVRIKRNIAVFVDRNYKTGERGGAEKPRRSMGVKLTEMWGRNFGQKSPRTEDSSGKPGAGNSSWNPSDP